MSVSVVFPVLICVLIVSICTCIRCVCVLAGLLGTHTSLLTEPVDTGLQQSHLF